MSIQFVNLTPHNVVVYRRPGDHANGIPPLRVIEPSGHLIRIVDRYLAFRLLSMDSMEYVSKYSDNTATIEQLAPERFLGCTTKGCTEHQGSIHLPDPTDNTLYIVSRAVAEYVRSNPDMFNCRTAVDLLFPHNLVRDRLGAVVGCTTFGTLY